MDGTIPLIEHALPNIGFYLTATRPVQEAELCTRRTTQDLPLIFAAFLSN